MVTTNFSFAFFRYSTTITPTLTESIPTCWKSARGERASNGEPQMHRRWRKGTPPEAQMLTLQGPRRHLHPPSDVLATAASIPLHGQLLPHFQSLRAQRAARGSPFWPSSCYHHPAAAPRMASSVLLVLHHSLQCPCWQQPQLCRGQGHPTAKGQQCPTAPPAPAAPTLQMQVMPLDPSAAHPRGSTESRQQVNSV